MTQANSALGKVSVKQIQHEIINSKRSSYLAGILLVQSYHNGTADWSEYRLQLNDKGNKRVLTLDTLDFVNCTTDHYADLRCGSNVVVVGRLDLSCRKIYVHSFSSADAYSTASSLIASPLDPTRMNLLIMVLDFCAGCLSQDYSLNQAYCQNGNGYSATNATVSGSSCYTFVMQVSVHALRAWLWLVRC